MLKITSLLVSLLFLGGCASKIVHKPEVYEVKKVAIISLFGNHGVYNVQGGGGLSEGLSALSSLVGKNKVSDKLKAVSDFKSEKLYGHALKVFEKELAKVRGWEIVSSKKIVRTKAYKKFLNRIAKHGRALASLQKFGQAMWKAPKGMKPLLAPHDDTEGSKTMQDLQGLARDLGVDAVAVVKLDLAYEPWVAVGSSVPGAFGGTGTAKAAVATSLKLVTKNAKFAVLTPEADRSKGKRSLSEETTTLLGGNIRYSASVETMYLEAIERSARAWRERINEELL